MKVLLAQSAVYVPTHGGENKANRLLLEALAQRGHTCRVLAPAFGVQGARSEDLFREELARREIRLSGTSPRSFSFEANGVAVSAVRESSMLPAALVEEIRTFAPDRILVSSEDPGHALLEAAAETQPARTVYLAHTMLFFPFGPNSFARSHAMTEAFRRLGGVITVSGFLRDYIREWTGRDAAVIPFPAFGEGPFPPLGRFDAGTVTFINPCAYKGITIFLELARSMPDVAFAAVPSWGTTAADRAALERQDNVRILPARDDLDELFADTRALLVPSLWAEGFPLVPVEAMLRGIPVLASDSGGLPEAKLGVPYVIPVRRIENYTEHFDEKSLPIAVVPEQDVDPWRAALRSLFSDRARYEQLSAQSRAAAAEYASRLGAGPFESYLEQLPGASAPRSEPKRGRPEADRDEIRQRLEHLSPEKRALLLTRLRKAPADADRIPGRKAGEESAVSFAQERLWFLDRMDPGSAAYNNFDALHLTGSLDVPSLERALDEIRRRHESLRMTFPEVGGQPKCLVTEHRKTTLTVRNLSRIPGTDRETEVERMAMEEARQPFDLGRGPLFRASLLSLGPAEHVLMMGIHHIVSDGWSFGVLLRELAQLYGAFSKGRPSPLPELPVQYTDFARWQRERLSGPVLEELLEDWKARMTPVPEVLELPADRPRPRVRSQAGKRERVVWEGDFAERLRVFSREEGVTLFMTLMAGFQVLLHRYTGQNDLVIGTPIANRNRSEWEALIGLFVNTLTIRVDASGDPTFREFLARVREAAVASYSQADLPFEKLVASVRPERDMSHTPIFQVMLAMQNTPRQIPELPGVGVRPLEVDNRMAKFDLTLDLTESEQGLTAELEYSTDLFDRDRVRRLLGHLRTLLKEAVAKPEHRLSRLPMLTEAERRELLDERNQTAASYPSTLTIHQLFERQVERTPDAVAVHSGRERVSYAELDTMANRIAHELRRQGVGPEAVVGLCLDRGAGLVAAILGVLKAGGAYLPLDAQYPARRLAFMLSDSGTRLLLTQRSLLERVPIVEGTRTLLIDDLPLSDSKKPALEVLPEALAYLIYTSGSTGTPKGVLITHRSVANLLSAVQVTPGFSASDVLAAVTTTSFDIAGLELFLPLVTGGQLAILTREQASDGVELARELRERDATVLQATPATWRMLLDSGWPGLPPLRMLCGGEALPADLAQALEPRGRELWNMYGPTETTIYSSVHRVAGSGPGLVPIGRPIANTRMYVLDRTGQPTPSGVAGELYIAGDGLARGYWNRPEMSAERFVPDPFGDPGGRLFRTGDLVRYRGDGALEYLGRLDHQIKLRGFRIELQEIDAHLSQHPAVRESVVVARVAENGEKTLVAYLAGSGAETVGSVALRAFLKDRLPHYMLPSSYVWMAALPRTRNGKVDRRALPAADRSMAAPRPHATPPASPVEEILADIFGDLLGHRVVHREDDFFDLGGHSLLATQLVSRIGETLGVRLPLRRVFEASTLGSLAAAVLESRARTAGREGQALPEDGKVPRHGDSRLDSRIQSIARDGTIPLSFAQQGLWFLDQLEPNNPFYNVLLALHVSGSLDGAALEQTLGEIVRRHEALRTVFPTMNGHAVQSILPPDPVVLQTRTLERLRGRQRRLEAERYATEEVKRPFDLVRGPLLRASLLRFAEEEHFLLLTMHHIACDGWSISLFLRELAAIYGAFSRGLPSPLEPLPIQYADYAVWQREALFGEGLRQKLGYWTRQLEGSPAHLDLSIARPRPAVVDYRGESRRFEISGTLADASRSLSRRERVTLFMTLVAAFQVLLSHYTGEEDVVIGTDVANRTELELEGMIGHFVNQVVLRTDLSGDPSFLELLWRVREVTLEAYANQDAPFDRVVEAVRPERTVNYSPLFEVKLVLQGAPVTAEESFPFTPSALDVHSGMVKFDLMMSLRDEGTSLAGTMEYATALFDAATIDRLVDDFRSVLGRVVTDPEVRLSALRDLLTEEDRRRDLRKRRDLKDASLQKVARARRKVVFAEAETDDLS